MPLRQVRGVNEPFEGISVIVVGDLNQLPSVMDWPVFQPPKINELSIFVKVSVLWRLFKFFELTQVMRQKDEADFINALNNLAAGSLTKENIALFKSRVRKDE